MSEEPKTGAHSSQVVGVRTNRGKVTIKRVQTGLQVGIVFQLLRNRQCAFRDNAALETRIGLIASAEDHRQVDRRVAVGISVA
jgi:hypothetical protein